MLKLVKPNINYKEKAIDYINEFYQYNSNINGTGSLDSYLENKTYEEWLNYLEYKEKEKQKEKRQVNSSTYFLVDDEDQIIGMINIRHTLNEFLLNYAGHIGYSIRPTKRKNGYNKINLYLGLEKCKELEIKKALVTANDLNPASYKTIEALGGFLENKIIYEDELSRRYWIDVEKSLKKYKNLYSQEIGKTK